MHSDVEGFKKLNDTQGHQMGDETLKRVARIDKEEVEGIGIAGRYGGEEIVALILDTAVDPEDKAERIRFQVEDLTTVTVSVGFARSTEVKKSLTEVGQCPQELIFK